MKLLNLPTFISLWIFLTCPLHVLFLTMGVTEIIKRKLPLPFSENTIGAISILCLIYFLICMLYRKTWATKMCLFLLVFSTVASLTVSIPLLTFKAFNKYPGVYVFWLIFYPLNFFSFKELWSLLKTEDKNMEQVAKSQWSDNIYDLYRHEGLGARGRFQVSTGGTGSNMYAGAGVEGGQSISATVGYTFNIK